MVWLLTLYLIMSVVISLSAAFHIGIAAGLYAVLTIALALIAGTGLKATLFWGHTVHRIGGPRCGRSAGDLGLLAVRWVFGRPVQLSLHRRRVGCNRVCDRFSVGEPAHCGDDAQQTAGVGYLAAIGSWLDEALVIKSILEWWRARVDDRGSGAAVSRADQGRDPGRRSWLTRHRDAELAGQDCGSDGWARTPAGLRRRQRHRRHALSRHHRDKNTAARRVRLIVKSLPGGI